jgi:hypothetical protein
MRRFIIFTPYYKLFFIFLYASSVRLQAMAAPITKHYLGDQIKNFDRDNAYCTYGGEQICIQGFGVKLRGEKDHLEDLGLRWEDSVKTNLKEIRWA